MPQEVDTLAEAVSRPREPALGRVWKPVSITETKDSLEILVPVRRTRTAIVVAVVAGVFLAIELLRILLIFVAAFGSASAESLGTVFAAAGLGLLTILLTRVFLILCLCGLLFGIIGTIKVSVTRGKVTLRPGIDRLRVYYNSTDFHPTTLQVSANQQARGFWQVCLDPSSGRRPVCFGAMHLTHAQTEGIAQAIASFVSGETSTESDA